MRVISGRDDPERQLALLYLANGKRREGAGRKRGLTSRTSRPSTRTVELLRLRSDDSSPSSTFPLLTPASSAFTVVRVERALISVVRGPGPPPGCVLGLALGGLDREGPSVEEDISVRLG